MVNVTDQGRVTLDLFQGQLSYNKTTLRINVCCKSSDTV